MRIGRLAAAFAVMASLAAASAAQGAVVRWWVKPPAAYGELAPATPVQVTSVAHLLITENTGAVGKCVFKDSDTVENPASTTASGTDKMTLFAGSCKRYPWPCTTTETVQMNGGSSLPWASVLTEPSAGIYDDAFTAAAFEVKCVTSSLTALYTETLMEPEVLPNELKFTFTNNGFKSGTHEFHFQGSDKLETGRVQKNRGEMI